MDTLLKSVENKLNASIDKTTEMPVKKPKQLTLFDMKGKGKFNLSSSEADRLNSSLNNSMLNSSKHKMDDSVEIIDSDGDDADVDVVEDNLKEIDKLINSSAKKLDKKSAEKNPKKEKPNAAHDESDVIEEDSKEIDQQLNKSATKNPEGKVSNEKSAEKKPKKEKSNAFETKKNGNIMSFFDKTDKSSAPTRSPKKQEKKVQVKVNLEEVGKLVLVDENKKVNDEDNSVDERYEFKNEMFADIATIVETYNTFVYLYFTRSRKVTKVDCKKIDYKAFLQMLKYDTKEAKESFIKFIKNLLIILLEHENFFEKIEVFDKHITDFSQNICFLQELCRILVSVINLNVDSKNDEVLFDSTTFDTNQDGKYALIRELCVNLSQEPFSDLSLNSKIQLIKTLCDQILVGDKFLSECDRLENAAHQNRQNIRLYQSELTTLIGTSNYSKCPAEKLEPKNIKTIIKDIERNKEELNETSELMKKFERIEPLAVDKDGNRYWNFSFIRGIVLEIKTGDENKSKWFSFGSKSQIKQIHTYLKEDQKDLASIFTDFMANLDESIVEAEVVVEETNDQVDKEETKSKRKSSEKYAFGEHFERYERRSTRLSSKALSVTEEERKSVKNDQDFEVNEDDEDECKEEKYKHIDWFHNLTDEINYSIDDLFTYLVNEMLTIDFMGFGSLTRNPDSEEFILNRIVNSFGEAKDMQTKLDATKDILLEIFTMINKNYVEYKFYNIIQKEGFKYTIWKSYLDSAKSLSSIYFLSYVLISELKWDGLKRKGSEERAPREKCMNCDKGGLKYTKINDLKELDVNKAATQGCVLCLNCGGPIHKLCVDESTKITKLSYRCKKCEQAKLKYTMESVSVTEKGFSAEICEENYVPGVRTRKQRTSVDQKSTSQCSSNSNSRRNSTDTSQLSDENEYRSKTTGKRKTADEKNSIKIKKHEEKCMKIALKIKSKLEKKSAKDAPSHATSGTRSSTRNKIVLSSSQSENDSESDDNQSKKLRAKSFYNSKSSEPSLSRTRSLRSSATASTTSEISESSSRQRAQKKSVYCEQSSTDEEN